MENQEEDKTLIFYYFRENYYNQMLEACKAAMSKYKTNITFDLLYALSLSLNNRVEESINELDRIRSETDVNLAAIIALMYTHKLLKGTTDRELFQKLDAEMRDLRKNASSRDYYNSGIVLFVFEKLEKVVDYLDKALSRESNFLDALVLKGWTLLQIRKRNQQKHINTKELFENNNFVDKKYLDGTLGLIESYLYQNKYDEALNMCNKAITKFPNSPLPVIFKMKVQFCTKDWDQVIETLNRVININANDLDAMKMNVIILLCRDANYEEAVLSLEKYVNCLDVKENRNGKVAVENAQLFSRICDRNVLILNQTFKMVESVVQIYPDKAEFVAELGYQALMLDKIRDATRFFKSASKIDNASLKALTGLILCDLKQPNSQTLKRIDYLMEFEGVQNSSVLHYLKARVSNNRDEILTLFKRACELHLTKIKSTPYSDYYLLLLDPDYILEVAREAMNYITTDNIKSASFIQNVLLTITKSCPGLYGAIFLLAKLQYLKGDLTNAMNTLEKILNRTDGNSNANLLMAQIEIQSGLFQRAAQSLEIGLSNNFQVRDDPMYHYLKGVVDKNSNNIADAIKSLTTALSLVQTDLTITNKDKAAVYIELIDINNSIGANEEAAKLLELALEQFKNTPEEARILIVNSEQALQRKNVQQAIDLLNRIKPGEDYYLQAKHKLADILLNHRKDRFAYLECYQEMVKENPGSDSYLLLGNAYMNVLEPDDALDAYNKALQINPSDINLIQKMGKALIETHYFAKAVEFYKEYIKQTNSPDLKLQLADLYIKLGEFKKAESLLVAEVESEQLKDFEDLINLQQKSKLLNLLALTQEKSGSINAALSTLKNAKDNQNRVRKRFLVEQNGVPETEIQLLLNICSKSAELSIALKDNSQAIQLYKDALDVKNNDVYVMTALAKLYMQMNYLEPCQQICSSILKLDPNNEVAAVIMADIAFRKIDFDMALFHFTQLILKQPTNWAALVRLVEILRRTGNLEEAPEYLNNSDVACSSLKKAGLTYCKALYEWYSGNLNSALRNFNAVRQDNDWGLQALYNMIEICLNPDNEMLGDQFMDHDDVEYRDSRSMALKTADRLLKELKQRLESNNSNDTLRYRLLVNFRLLATKDKFNIERALEDFVAITSQQVHKDQIGPILGMATAYTFLKQSQRAKNQLKRVAKTQWTFEDADYLERCWLLLSDYYIQSSKMEQATDLLNKVVQHNKSCSKAYEYLGFIAEKEQNYKSATHNYERSWKFGGKSNASIGYKLAYSYMKLKKYPDAIDTAQEVLKLNPDYPKMKKDILDKCISNLRT